MAERSSADKEHGARPVLRVGSFAELMKHEKEILERIKGLPNGGQLFLIHPFLLFKDIGVELSERAEQELRRYQPSLTALSAVPYQALKNSKEKQHVRFHVRGLFERRKKS
jgi:hypothetical protein